MKLQRGKSGAKPSFSYLWSFIQPKGMVNLPPKKESFFATAIIRYSIKEIEHHLDKAS